MLKQSDNAHVFFKVLVKKDPELMGKLVDVEIVDTCKFSMTGRLLSDKDSASSPGLSQPLKKGQVSGVPDGRKQQQRRPLASYSWVYYLSMAVLAAAIFLRVGQLIGYTSRSANSTALPPR